MEKDLNTELEKLSYQLTGKTIEESLNILVSLFPGKVVFTTSFGIEDQVLTHIIFKNNIPIEIVTLDTGRLFPETYRVFNETIKKYRKNVRVFCPDHMILGQMISQKGPFSFYYSKENRLECCNIRKVEPLGRILTGSKCWISGVRAGQSDNRSKMDWLEYDKERQLFRFHPLFKWSLEDVEEFISKNEIPYNRLHDKGFISIGCEPCTRAVRPGEDFRSGRWWWEHGGEKECGLHVK